MEYGKPHPYRTNTQVRVIDRLRVLEDALGYCFACADVIRRQGHVVTWTVEENVVETVRQS